MKKFVIHIGALLFGFILGTLLFNGALYFHSNICNTPDGTPTMTAITALKERLNSCFYDEVDDEFVNLINYEDEEFGEDALFAVYYRQKNGATTNFLIVPDAKTKSSWVKFLTKVRNNNTSHLLGELEQFSFSLQGETIWVMSSVRRA